MKQGSTNRKVNQQAREVIASILLFEISDPRLSLVTITGCEVSYDRSVCNVFYTADRGEYEEVAEASRRLGPHPLAHGASAFLACGACAALHSG